MVSACNASFWAVVTLYFLTVNGSSLCVCAQAVLWFHFTIFGFLFIFFNAVRFFLCLWGDSFFFVFLFFSLASIQARSFIVVLSNRAFSSKWSKYYSEIMTCYITKTGCSLRLERLFIVSKWLLAGWCLALMLKLSLFFFFLDLLSTVNKPVRWFLCSHVQSF